MNLIINNDYLQDGERGEKVEKVRAILISSDNSVLIADYNNVLLFPGGKVEKDETIYQAIIRELKEELGHEYSLDELNYLKTLEYYQKDYPKRDGTHQNRLVRTHYFVGKYQEVDNKIQSLTENEIKGNFKLELVSIEELERYILSSKSENPRNIYFQTELKTILDYYRRNI